jgi:hypothetical protein
MAEYLFQRGYKNKAGEVKVKLLLIHFKDEGNIHFIYSPHLDLTGYGQNLKDAKKSFEIVFEDFVDYTLKKKTLGKILTDLGWELKGTLKRPKKILAPSITSIISQNEYVSEIFD